MADIDDELLGGPEGGPSMNEEEEEAFEPVEVIREFGNHPLMKSAQDALVKQLKAQADKLEVRLLDKKADYSYITRDHETQGVQLYSLQQQLATLQVQLEGSHDKYNNLVDKKLQEIELLKNQEENNAVQQRIKDEHDKQLKTYEKDRESLRETIRQIQKYNEETKGEIALKRRATYKIEQGMQEVEKVKEIKIKIKREGRRVHKEEKELRAKTYRQGFGESLAAASSLTSIMCRRCASSFGVA